MERYYKVIIRDDYVYGYKMTDETDYDYYGIMPEEAVEGWYQLINGVLVEDLERKEEIIEDREHTPTWEEAIESQVYYTALMTDTLIEEEE